MTTPTNTQRPTAGAGRRRFTVRRTRIGGWWVALVAAALVLLLLLIFVLQNGQSAHLSFLGAHGTLPLGIALLLAAIAGVLIVAIPGSGRIIQLRHLARRQAGSGPREQPEPATGQEPAEDRTDQPQATVPAGDDKSVPHTR